MTLIAQGKALSAHIANVKTRQPGMTIGPSKKKAEITSATIAERRSLLASIIRLTITQPSPHHRRLTMSDRKQAKRWAVYNYDTFLDAFYTRRQAREYIVHDLIGTEIGAKKALREKSMTIEKVIIRPKNWVNQWSVNRP